MASIKTDIEIDAPPDAVWIVLMNFEAYPSWNPYIVRLSGHPDVGETLEVRLELPGGPAMTISPTVTAHEVGAAFHWLGHVLVPGIFDGEHMFELEPLESGRTRFIQRERFSGILVAPLLWLVGGKTEDGFRAMNRALKERVESSAAAAGTPSR